MSKNPRMQHHAFMALIKTLDKDEIAALVEEMDSDPRDTLLEKLRTYDAIMNPQNYVDHHSAQRRSLARCALNARAERGRIEELLQGKTR